MYSGYARFEARVEDLELPLMTITSADTRISSIELEAPQGKPLAITVRFASIPSQQEARDCARAAAKDVVDRVAFELMVSIGDAWLESDALNPLPGSSAAGGPMLIGQSIGLSMTGAVWVCPNATKLAELKQTLEAPTTTLVGAHLMGTYRSALKIRNPVDRFLCLYNILLLQNGDYQSAVDSFIRTHEPSVSQSPSPKFPGVMETVYTRLRNEFSHIRTGTSFDQTGLEMKQNLSGLKNLARQACLLP